MGKLFKLTLIVGVVILVLGGLALLSIDLVAKKGIETGGTAALGVHTSVQTVSIRLFDGIVGITGLQIDNPEGYDTEYLVRLGSSVMEANLGTLLSRVFVVDQILIDGPQMSLEMKGLVPPRSNLGDVLDNLQAAREELPPEQKEKEKQFKIGLLRITNAKVRLESVEGERTEVTLPTIELRDVKNTDGSPVVLADVLGIVLASMAEASVEHGGVPRGFSSALNKSLKSRRRMLTEKPSYLPGEVPGIIPEEKTN